MWRNRLLLIALLVSSTPTVAHAELEHELKAAYVFKFLTYVEWPASAFPDEHAPIVIGVLDAEEVRDALTDIVSARRAQGRRIAVRRFGGDESTSGVHVLFFGRSAVRELPKFAGRSGVLLMSEAEGALDRGSMINLLRVGDRVRFEVDPDAAERSGLHISSRVLPLAQFVKSEGR
jgi:hypothetical protein